MKEVEDKRILDLVKGQQKTTGEKRPKKKPAKSGENIGNFTFVFLFLKKSDMKKLELISTTVCASYVSYIGQQGQLAV